MICAEYKASRMPAYSNMPSQQKFAGLKSICRMTCTTSRYAGTCFLRFVPSFLRPPAQCSSSHVQNPIISNPPAISSRMGGGGASVEDGVLAMPALRRHPMGQSRFPACLAEGAEIYCVSPPPVRVLGLAIARLRARPGGVSPAMRRL